MHNKLQQLNDFLREKISYNPTTGILMWNERAHYTVRGKQAGSPDGQGYLKLHACGAKRYVHRVAWYLQYGVWPPLGFEIDHINMDRSDNRICNLRLARRGQNVANSSRKRTSNNPYKGVYRHKAGRKKVWQAKIAKGGKTTSLGYYATAEEAHEAYKAAALKYHGEFARFK